MDNLIAAQEPQTPAVRTLAEIEADILTQKRTIGMSIIQIGRALIEAKAQLAHGEWGGWLRDKVQFSQSSANNYMAIAEQIGETSPLARLEYSKILPLLALPAEEREAFAEEIGAEDRSAREIKRLIAERDKARAEASHWMKSAEENAHAATAMQKQMENERDNAQREARAQRQLAETLNQERGRLQAMEHELKILSAKEPDVVTIREEVIPEDYEALKRRAAQADEMEAYIDSLPQGAQEAEADPMDIGPFCDACAAFLNKVYAAPYAKAFFEGCSDAQLERYASNVGLVEDWARKVNVVLGLIRADRDDAAIESFDMVI